MPEMEEANLDITIKGKTVLVDTCKEINARSVVVMSLRKVNDTIIKHQVSLILLAF